MRHASSRGDFVPFVSVLDVVLVPQVAEDDVVYLDGLTLMDVEKEIDVPSISLLDQAMPRAVLRDVQSGEQLVVVPVPSLDRTRLRGEAYRALDGLMFGEHVVQVLAKMFGEHAVQVLAKMLGEHVVQVLAAVYKPVAETVCFSLQVR